MIQLLQKHLSKTGYELDKLTLEQLSQKCYISQSALSRFIKKLGYKNYNEFKEALSVSMYSIKRDHEVLPKERHKNNEEMVNDIYQETLRAIDNIYNIDIMHLQRVVNTLKQYQNIVFLGSELSMAITYLLQLALIYLGKNVYTIYEYTYQKEMLEKADKDTLVVFISLEERWFEHFARNINICSDAYKMLWTIEEQHTSQEIFEDVYVFGKPLETNFGYSELMYFIMLVYRMVLNEDDSFKK